VVNNILKTFLLVIKENKLGSTQFKSTSQSKYLCNHFLRVYDPFCWIPIDSFSECGIL